MENKTMFTNYLHELHKHIGAKEDFKTWLKSAKREELIEYGDNVTMFMDVMVSQAFDGWDKALKGWDETLAGWKRTTIAFTIVFIINITLLIIK